MTLDVFTVSGKTSKRPSKEKSEESSPNHVALLPLFAISTAATPTANHEDVHKLFQNLKYNSIKPGSKGFHTKTPVLTEYYSGAIQNDSRLNRGSGDHSVSYETN